MLHSLSQKITGVVLVWFESLTNYEDDGDKNVINILSKFLAQDNDFPAFWLVP